jgi:glycosyltransferase involved in cell wall biosynthesis
MAEARPFESPALDARSQLGAEIARWTREQLELFVARYCPEWTVPRLFAGYPVGADVRADLAYTVGLLDAAGEGLIGGVAAAEAIAQVLRPIDGAATHTFASYRVAETLARYGDFDNNRLLAGWSAAERANLAAACDSTAWVALLDHGTLPANYAAVLARCELARASLGLCIDEAALDRLVGRVAGLITRHPSGWHDDSPIGAGRFDIYAADLYLFAEPLAASARFAPRLNAAWRRGVRAVLDLVEKVGARNGAAFSWGRSTGALAVCLTVELGALAASRGADDRAAFWLGRAAHGFAQFPGWMRDGLISAHRQRAPYSYRGPQRLLQMTLDALGKLAWAAVELRNRAACVHDALATPQAPAADPAGLFPTHDELIRFRDAPLAGVWTYRSRALRIVVPLVGSTLNDYLPAPQAPTFLEVPVELELPTGVPMIVRAGSLFTCGGAPVAIEHQAGGLHVEWNRFPRAGVWDCSAATPALAGGRVLELTVRGGMFHAHDHLHFDEPPDGVALQVAESARRPLRVAFQCDVPHRVSTIDTAGIKEYRSFWGELPRVHHIEMAPAPAIDLRWSVAPVLRVATTASTHHYNLALYEPLRGRVAERQFPFEWMADPDAVEASEFLSQLDTFHLHWPEWISHSGDVHRALIARLRSAEVRILWTQHNLVPHFHDPALAEIYRAWADAADAVIHHSRYGERVARARYTYQRDALHCVVPHPHFGHLMEAYRTAQRIDVERELGLPPCAIRLGIVGAPRADKDVQLVLDGFAACRRADLGLLVLSLGPDDRVPDDPRITALPYEMVDRATYDRRLRAVDVVVLPIRGGELLTSGVVGDAVGAGLPSLVSTWEFLTEVLGDAGIRYGSTGADLTRCLDRLAPADLARAAAASRALQPLYARERIADLTLDVLTELGSAKL